MFAASRGIVIPLHTRVFFCQDSTTIRTLAQSPRPFPHFALVPVGFAPLAMGKVFGWWLIRSLMIRYDASPAILRANFNLIAAGAHHASDGAFVLPTSL